MKKVCDLSSSVHAVQGMRKKISPTNNANPLTDEQTERQLKEENERTKINCMLLFIAKQQNY